MQVEKQHTVQADLLLLLVALMFVLINLAVDLLYFAVDPRLRMGRGIAAH